MRDPSHARYGHGESGGGGGGASSHDRDISGHDFDDNHSLSSHFSSAISYDVEAEREDFAVHVPRKDQGLFRFHFRWRDWFLAAVLLYCLLTLIVPGITQANLSTTNSDGAPIDQDSSPPPPNFSLPCRDTHAREVDHCLHPHVLGDVLVFWPIIIVTASPVLIWELVFTLVLAFVCALLLLFVESSL